MAGWAPMLCSRYCTSLYAAGVAFVIRRPHLHQPMMFLATAFGFLLLSSPMLASTLSEGCLLLRLASLPAMYLALSMTSLCRYEPHQWQGNRFSWVCVFRWERLQTSRPHPGVVNHYLRNILSSAMFAFSATPWSIQLTTCGFYQSEPSWQVSTPLPYSCSQAGLRCPSFSPLSVIF